MVDARACRTSSEYRDIGAVGSATEPGTTRSARREICRRGLGITSFDRRRAADSAFLGWPIRFAPPALRVANACFRERVQKPRNLSVDGISFGAQACNDFL